MKILLRMGTERNAKRYRSTPVGHLLKPTSVKGATPMDRLNKELSEAYERIRLGEAEVAARDGVVARYKRIIEGSLDCRVEAFGSARTRLLVHGSDVDLTVLVRRGRGGDKAATEQGDDKAAANATLAIVKAAIEKAGAARGGVMHIRKARTPILKLTDRLLGLRVDISANKTDGIEAAEFVKQRIAECPSLAVLAVLIKYFLKRRGLSDAANGGLCSYAQFLLVLNFAAMHPLIQNGNIAIEQNLGALLMDFFLYFGVDFPYERSAIHAGGCVYRLNRSGGLCIDDPIHPGNNVASGCSCIRAIRDVFQHSYKIMAAALASKAAASKGFVHLWLRVDASELNERETVLKGHRAKL